jgi:hypothetical protein
MLQDSLHKSFLAGRAIWRMPKVSCFHEMKTGRQPESSTINPKERPRWGVLSVALYQDFDRQRSGNIAAAGLSRDV